MSVPAATSFEAHVTIEPVFGERFDAFERLCRAYHFRPAELLLQKQRAATPERSTKDSFCTSHGQFYVPLLARTETLVNHLRYNGFRVWRYKIEGILIDVRTPPLVRIADGAVKRLS